MRVADGGAPCRDGRVSFREMRQRAASTESTVQARAQTRRVSRYSARPAIPFQSGSGCGWDPSDAVLAFNSDVLAEFGSVEVLASRLTADPGVRVVSPIVGDAVNGRVLHGRCTLDLHTGAVGWADQGLSREELGVTSRETAYASGEAFLARADVFRVIVALIRRRRFSDAARGAAAGRLVGAARVLVGGRR